MKFDILNDGGEIAGKLGLTWTAYAMDAEGNVWPVASSKAKSESVDEQLRALYDLEGKVLADYPNAMLRDMTITGESLSLSEKSLSPVKQWILSKMNKP